MMMKWLALAAFGSLLAVGLVNSRAKAEDADERPGKLLRHVVLFKFKDTTSPEKQKEIERAFAQLPSKIDEIVEFEWGTDVSTENLANGFTHCFFVSFQDKAGRDAYLPHPEHQKFVELVKPHLDKVLVVDYWSRDWQQR